MFKMYPLIVSKVLETGYMLRLLSETGLMKRETKVTQSMKQVN